MKKKNKILLGISAILLLSFAAVVSQYTPIGSAKTWLEVLGGIQADSAFRLPQTYNKTYTTTDSVARMWYNPADKNIYFHNGMGRQRLADTAYVDSFIAGGGLALGDLVADGTYPPGILNAILYRTYAGPLGADTFFRYDGDFATFWLRGKVTGDTLIIAGGPTEYVKFPEGKIILGLDTLDGLSLLTGGRKQQFQDKTGIVADLSDIQNLAQADIGTTTGPDTLINYTNTSGGTVLNIGGYVNWSGLGVGDSIMFVERYTDNFAAVHTVTLLTIYSTFVASTSVPLQPINSKGSSQVVLYVKKVGSISASYTAGAVIKKDH